MISYLLSQYRCKIPLTVIDLRRGSHPSNVDNGHAIAFNLEEALWGPARSGKGVNFPHERLALFVSVGDCNFLRVSNGRGRP